MKQLSNPYRGRGIETGLAEVPAPSVDAPLAAAIQARAFDNAPTPLVQALGMHIKDERGRMGLGSFKALGAAYVIAHEAEAAPVKGRTFVTASAGNHGLSLAMGAARFDARAVIYLSQTVPAGFADRLRAMGAEAVIEGADYEASMEAAQRAAVENGWTLLSDSSWAGYTELPHRLMEGYTTMAAECAEAMEPPSHIFLQAGVGGLAGACAAYFRHAWGEGPHITVVEPEFAPALHACIEAGEFVSTQGPVSDMGRLDCKEASLIALKGLSKDADEFVLISEDEAAAILPELSGAGLASSPSGAAGVAAARLSDLPADARVLCILSEGA